MKASKNAGFSPEKAAVNDCDKGAKKISQRLHPNRPVRAS